MRLSVKGVDKGGRPKTLGLKEACAVLELGANTTLSILQISKKTKVNRFMVYRLLKFVRHEK